MINGIALNSPVVVTFSPESREFNDRWYTDLRCIRVVPMVAGIPTAAPAAAPTTAPAPSAAPFASKPAEGDDDLPF